MPTPTRPIVCDLSVLSAEQRARVEELARERFALASALRELPDGYAVGFADASPDVLADLAEFIALDRLCCPFLRHALVSDAGTDFAWLELTGGAGAKDAIASDVLALLPPDLAGAPNRAATTPG